MFRYNFIVLFLVIFTSFSSQASYEQLDVLVLFDDSLDEVSELNSYQERVVYAEKLVKDINRTLNNTGINGVIDLKLKHFGDFNFTNTRNGVTENIEEVMARYSSYMPDIFSSGNPKGSILFAQDAYNADVVIAVSHGGNNVSTFCGMALNIPNHDNANVLNYLHHREVVKAAFSGIFFISAKSQCLESKHLASHEFGHTAGLFHEPIESFGNTTIDHTENMLVPGAAGLIAGNNFTTKFSTIMIPADKRQSYHENRFSDKNASWGCGQWQNYSCGNHNSDAKATLLKFAAFYNARGNWTDRN